MTNLPSQQELLEQFGGVPRILERVLKGFISSTPEQITKMQVALRSGDAQCLSKTAHAYKGTLGYFTQGPLYETVVRVEDCAKSAKLEEAAGLLPLIATESENLVTHLSSMVGKS